MDMHPLRLVFVLLSTLIYPLFHTSFFNFLSVLFSAQGYTKRNMPSWTSSWHTVIKKLTLFVRHLHHSLMNYFISCISNDDDDGIDNVAKIIWICVLSNFIASIWTRSICQMQATFPGVEFLRVLLRFKKRKENLSSYVHVLHKTSNWEV